MRKAAEVLLFLAEKLVYGPRGMREDLILQSPNDMNRNSLLVAAMSVWSIAGRSWFSRSATRHADTPPRAVASAIPTCLTGSPQSRCHTSVALFPHPPPPPPSVAVSAPLVGVGGSWFGGGVDGLGGQVVERGGDVQANGGFAPSL